MSAFRLHWVLALFVPLTLAEIATHTPCKCPVEQLKVNCECVFFEQCDEHGKIFKEHLGSFPSRHFSETCPTNEKCCVVPSVVDTVPQHNRTVKRPGLKRGMKKLTTTTVRTPTLETTTTTRPTTAFVPNTTTSSTIIIPIGNTANAALTSILPEDDNSTPLPTPEIEGGCGVRRSEPSETSPSATSFGEFPWMVAVLNITQQRLATYQCGGALINHGIVLTAAHCVRSRGPQELVVRAGDWDLASTHEPLKPQDRRVGSIILHPQFNVRTLANDLALLVLTRPLNRSRHIDTICLPDSDTDFSAGRCTVTSWGSQLKVRADRSSVLHQVQLSVLNRAQCRAALRKAKRGKYFRLDKSFLCARGVGDSACQADGGSPLTCESTRDPRRYYLAGILAGGLGCGVEEAPALFAHVSVFNHWIIRELKKLGLDLLEEHEI